MNPGSIVRCRNREWVLLPAETDDVWVLRPLAGTGDDAVKIHKGLSNLAGYDLPFERVTPASFPLPTPDDVADAASAHLLWQAARLTLREGATPFRSLGRISIRPRTYQFVPLLMALMLDPVQPFTADGNRPATMAAIDSGRRRALVLTDRRFEDANACERCTAVVRSDLPFNPLALQQRQKRAARYGQAGRRLKAVRFLRQDNPGNGVAIEVLLDKAGENRRALGTCVPMPEHPGALRHGSGTASPRPHAQGAPIPSNIPAHRGWGPPVAVRGLSSATHRIYEHRGTPGVTLCQRPYYEHIIRAEKSLTGIREYMLTDPGRWHLDQDHSNRTGRDAAWGSWFAPAGAGGRGRDDLATHALRREGDRR